MLVEFSVENFKSIKEKVTLSMLASSDDSNESNIIHTDKVKGKKLLKSAVIYGANASGKTNLIEALSFMDDFVKNSHNFQQGEEIPITPFLLDSKNINIPSKFDIIFINNDIKYNYGFLISQKEVIEEYLYSYKTQKPSMMFHRKNTTEIEFTHDKKEQETLFSRTTENKLYLSTAALWNYKPIEEVFKWFNNKLRSTIEIDPEVSMAYTASKCIDDNNFCSFVKNYLSIADFGVHNLKLKKYKIKDIDEIDERLSQEYKKEILKEIKNKDFINIELVHKGLDNNNEPMFVPLAFDDESDGTKKFFSLIGPFLDILADGKVLSIDELSKSLHPILVNFLINLFHKEKININSQLIFTTHDTNLLDLEIFRRDQIWFTEKNPDTGATDLYSLDDVNGVRKDENIQKGYLAGRYGAIPFIGDYSLLCQE